jgi:D-glycero-alpha-D-manno-heptose-7-phosphate kinase
MIITRTPLRISLAGGGTDIKSYYKFEPGRVINMAIDKYLYVVVKKQLGVVEYKYRINWSTVEFCNKINEIKHPIVREAIKYFKIDFPLEITTFSDVPANTGLGSSSSFTVGLVYALSSFLGLKTSKYNIATIAAKIEIDLVKRSIGKQDHFAGTYGGMNIFSFYENEIVNIEPVIYNNKTLKELENSFMLYYLGDKRSASSMLKQQNKNIKKNISILTEMKFQVDKIKKIIQDGKKLNGIGKILNEGWKLKKKLSNKITSKKINIFYNSAKNNGAIGGKVLGAGGGGFLLLYVPKNKQKIIRNKFKKLYQMPFKIDQSGTRITYFENKI